MSHINKYSTCYECPKYHHAGAFGSPKYAPRCGSRPLPAIVNNNDHAAPWHERISCIHLDFTAPKPIPPTPKKEKQMIKKSRILEYMDAKNALKRAQTLEHDLRLELLESAFGKNQMGKRSAAAGDYIIKGNFGTTMTLNKKLFEEALDEGEFDGTDCEKAISWKPSIIKKEYDELDEYDLDKLDEFITVKPSLPTIEIKLVPTEEE